jgi:beta-glucosidase
MGCRLLAQTWTNTALLPEQRADALLAAMTQSEKIAMVHGAGGPYVGNIPSNSRLGIPALNLQDGPAGVADGVSNVTAFPAPVGIAASWDAALARQCGAMLGQEERGKGVHVLLAPMMNIARVSQAGRNFEGFGEDPYLSGVMAAADVQGMQSQGVIATAKHFVCNDQETDRNHVSSDVDERTLQEVYYPPFRACVRAGAGAAMGSYNRVNGRFACEFEALNAVLRKLWGFDGWVMSDWGAVFSTVAGADNGLDMDMYTGPFGSSPLTAAIQAGNVPSSELDGMVHRILSAMFRFGVFDNPPTGNLNSTVTSAAHTQFSRDAAAQGVVLLKDNNGLLPLNLATVHSIAVIGSAANGAPISTGCGSAGVKLPYNVTPLVGISNRAGAGVTIRYNQGDGGNIPQAVALAQTSDVAIVCVGQQTCEGSDRSSLSLPNDQDALVNAVVAANSNTIVVIYSSAATLMPWSGQAAAELAAWYPGQENGNALAQVLFGDVNPSGKLPVTFPATASQVPASTPSQFPGLRGHVAYSEQLLEGYRWYDANNVSPIFAFGHGLSYTTFGYSNLTVSTVSSSGQVQVRFDLANTGSRAGAEVAQLYVGFPSGTGEPPKLLKGFKKVSLQPGQTQSVSFDLDWEDLANWDAITRGWLVTPGVFQVKVGSSSRDIRLTGSFTVNSNIPSSDLANAALHHAVTASSILNSNFPASTAVDGDPASVWVSAASDPQWLMVDLGLAKDLSRVRLQWNSNYAAAYSIQISPDATNWSPIYSTTTGQGGIEDLLVSGRSRYVRMLGTQQGLPGAGYSLLEFEVYAQPQKPFGGVVHRLPGRVEAEGYDTGGEGVAYFNTTVGNQGGVYRADDIGIEPTTDIGGGYDVGWINTGEWLEYTVNVPDPSALYSIGVRVASASGGGQLRLRLDGKVLGTVTIPSTGNWQNWQTLTLPTAPVSGGAGSKALRLEALSAGFNINWIQLDRVQICGTNNLAFNQPASASSMESASYPATNAVDGDPRSRWSSQFSDPQWLSVDIGSPQNIARIRLDWEAAYSPSYRIQFSSNNSTWTDAYVTTNDIGSINDLAVPGSGRYVRVYSTQRATGYGDSLYEFEVYPALSPALAIKKVATNVVVSWPVGTGNWTLETNPVLGTTNLWKAVTNAPAIAGSQNIVTNSPDGSARFYRLRSSDL